MHLTTGVQPQGLSRVTVGGEGAVTEVQEPCPDILVPHVLHIELTDAHREEGLTFRRLSKCPGEDVQIPGGEL